MTRARMTALALGTALLCGCGDGNQGSVSELSTTCSSKVTQNVYDGPSYWGTITIQNSDAAKWSGFSVSFDVPSGAHCTNDAVPEGATLSPLSGSGSSAHTTANHCVFTWASSSLAVGASKTFNYSTDSSSFSAAENVVASAASCGGGGGKLDFSSWELQLPDDSTIPSSKLRSGFANAYFYVAADGGQAFMDPQHGSPTGGSLHPRAELRELSSSGSAAAWSWSGTNTMTVTGAVTRQGGGSGGATTLGQVFDGSDGFPLCEFEYTQATNPAGGNFRLLYEEAKGNGTYVDLGTPCAIGQKYTFELSLSNGVLTVSVDGKQVYSHKPGYSGKTFYFKAGDYDQTATAGTLTTTPYTIAEIYSLNVVHGSSGGGNPPPTPSGLSVGSATTSSLAVSWNGASGASSYQVYRDTSSGGSFGNQVYDGSGTSFTDSGLSASTTYYYKVQASNADGSSALSPAVSATTASSSGGNFTAAQILAAVQAHMTSSDQVNTKPHINTMTRAMDVNVYQVTSGVYAYTSSMAVDTDGSDPDPDPDHQSQTTWTDDAGNYLGAHHVPYYVLGDYCYDKVSPCPHFYYAEHNITGLQFALIFYGGKVIGAVFGDTQGDSVTPTSDNDSRELGEASVESASLLGIPSSGTTGGVDDGVTVVIFSGPQWVVHGTNSTLSANAQALVQQALDTLGNSFGL